MTTVTGYTAEKMDQINASTVVGGHISGDNLILMTRGGTPINAGNVRGPEGPSGAPIGVINDYAGSTAPYRYLLCDGSLIPDGPEYDELRALVGPRTPDLRDRFVLSSGSKAVGETGGAATVALSIANLPSHNHGGATGTESADHTHWLQTGGQSQSHLHSADPETIANRNVDNRQAMVAVSGGWWYGINAWGTSWADRDHHHTATTAGRSTAHTHGITAQGSGTAHENMPPYYVLTKIIKAHN